MSKVAILTDSSAYIPKRYVDELGLHVLPLSVNWDGVVYRDGVDIMAGEFYTRMAKSESIPTTSQVTQGQYEEAFKSLLDKGYDVLNLGISSGISGSIQSAYQAKEMFKGARIEVFDTRLVSMALAFMVLTVARAAQAGASLEECLETAKKAYGHIGVYFTVETLLYLNKGGRINSAKRLMGTMLNVKPIMEIREGKIELCGSVISSRKAIERMVELTEAGIAGRSPVRISVFHAGIEDTARALLEKLETRFQPAESILSEVSPVVGSHTGPGTISIAYMAGM
jgi:DegV family protein with EDD domain